KPFPTDLPFPLREETILPSNFSEFSNIMHETASEIRFIYDGEDGELTYIVDKANPLSDIAVDWNGEQIQTITNRHLIRADDVAVTDLPATVAVNRDTAWFTSTVNWNGQEVPLTFFYTV